LRPDQGDDPTDGVGEATEVAALRLSLDPYYRFISLYGAASHPEVPTSWVKIPLYYGNIPEQLDGATAGRLPCDVVFYVAQNALESFLARYGARREACGDAPIVPLP
jgi:hypothetical protein